MVQIMPAETQGSEYTVKDVWRSNLESEFKKIRQVVQKYNYLSMDTEFPGVVARPIGEFRNQADYQYQVLRCNVDLLKVIQIGMSFFDEKGNPSKPISTWQFNFRFNQNEDMYAQDSIELLQNSGLEFDRHAEDGILLHDFAELLMTSGIVLTDSVRWMTFHSGYDFGYMIKALTNQRLPEDEVEFFDIMKIFFPNVYDIKYLMKSCRNLKGGLAEVSEQLEIPRVGTNHQAGVDSLVTGLTFFKMREMFFEDNIDDDKYNGHLYGLGVSCAMNGTSNNYDSTAQGYGPPMSQNSGTNSANSTNNGDTAAGGTPRVQTPTTTS